MFGLGARILILCAFYMSCNSILPRWLDDYTGRRLQSAYDIQSVPVPVAPRIDEASSSHACNFPIRGLRVLQLANIFV